MSCGEAINAGDLRARLTVIQRKDKTTFPVLALPQRILDEAGKVIETFAILVDLGTIQTAKLLAHVPRNDLRGTLERIALELQAIGLTAQLGLSASHVFSHPKLQGLTIREMEVLKLLAGGARVSGIAEQLYISPTRSATI